MENRKIIKKSGLYLIGNLSSKAMSSLLLPIYAIYVSTSELGMYDMIYTLCSIIIPLVFCCIWEAALRFVLKEKGLEKKIEYVSTISVFVFLIILILIIIGIVVGELNIIKSNYYEISILYIGVFGTAQVLQAISRALEYNSVYVISGICATIVNFIGVLFFVCLIDYGINGLLISSILGQVVVILIIITKVKLWNFIKASKFSSKSLRLFLIFSAPLILNHIVSWLITSFSKIVINVHIGVEANGLYSFANKFSVLVTMIGSVVAMALFEEAVLASETKNFGQKYGKAINDLNRLFFTVIICAFPIIILFYYIVAKDDYLPSRFLVPILLIYAIIMNFSTNIGSVFQVINKTQYQFITTVIGALVSSGLSYLLVFQWNIYGVVVGQTIGAFSLLAIRYFFTRKYIKININFKEILYFLVVFILIATLCLILPWWSNILVFCFTVILMLIININYIVPVLSLIKKKIKNNPSNG